MNWGQTISRDISGTRIVAARAAQPSAYNVEWNFGAG
jgi:hypothetical protein